MIKSIKKLIKIIEKKKRVNPQGKDRIANVLENIKVDVLPLIFWRPQNVSVPGKTYDVCVNTLGVVFFGEKISSGFGQTYPLFY